MSKDLEKLSLPAIFESFPKEIYPSSILTSFPLNTFLENITIDGRGDLYVTSLEEGIIYKVNPNGQQAVFAHIAGKPAGIVNISGSSFLVNGWDEQGIPTIYLISGHGEVCIMHQPPGAAFLNGMIGLNENEFLICDAAMGCIFIYRLKENESAVWLQHDLLAKADSNMLMPAANGIKLFNQHLFVSNTDKKTLIRIPISNNAPGEPKVWLDNLNLDDFAFDEWGNLYATTHIYNSVIKISPTKQVTVIAEAEQGLAGSTAVAFGRTPQDANYIYVTTNGGMSLPLSGGIENGRIVKIKVN